MGALDPVATVGAAGNEQVAGGRAGIQQAGDPGRHRLRAAQSRGAPGAPVLARSR